MALPLLRIGSPQDSLRWEVTSTQRRPSMRFSSGTAKGASRATTSRSASMTVLPVVTMAAAGTPEAIRFSREVDVGARCRLASCVVKRRLTSSGKGL